MLLIFSCLFQACTTLQRLRDIGTYASRNFELLGWLACSIKETAHPSPLWQRQQAKESVPSNIRL